jgi:heme/copper-type cytochrome/quinol oxidase subunit 2
MGVGLFLIVLAVIVLASWQYRADVKFLNDDYERWKKNRR